MLRFRRLFFSFVFGLTGIGSALIGASLPAVLHHWHLSDSRGGLLLLAMWGGSTCGALFAQGRHARTAATGLMLSAAGLLMLSLAGPAVLPFLYVTYGLGLGIAMTSISVMRAREVSAPLAGVELNRLNLLWAVGAFCSPALAYHSLRLLSVTTLFRGVGAVLGLCSALAFAFSVTRRPLARVCGDDQSPRTFPGWAPLRFALFAAAAVGLESAIGSWMTTYAERSTSGVLTAVSANSAFWAGLLLSRALHSVPSAVSLQRRSVRIAHIAAAGLALMLLILLPTRNLLAFDGLLCGWGLGPLYPWVLSITLPRFRSTNIFVFAGIGSSLTPWLTGWLSSVSGSLRIGLFTPFAVFLLLVAAAVFMRSELVVQSGTQGGSS